MNRLELDIINCNSTSNVLEITLVHTYGGDIIVYKSSIMMTMMLRKILGSSDRSDLFHVLLCTMRYEKIHIYLLFTKDHTTSFLKAKKSHCP